MTTSFLISMNEMTMSARESRSTPARATAPPGNRMLTASWMSVVATSASDMHFMACSITATALTSLYFL